MSSPRRLLRAALRRGRPPAESRPKPKPKRPPRPPRPPEVPLLRALERGRELDAAVIAQVRSLVSDGESHRAESIAESLRRHPDTEALGHLAGGIVAFRRGFHALAWAELQAVPREAWVRFAPAEYIRSGLAVAPDAALAAVRALAADDPPEVGAKSWFELLGPVLGLGIADLSRELFTIFDRHVREDAPGWDEAQRNRDWIAPWVAADPGSPTGPAPDGGRRTFAIMDYGHPGIDRGSANIGDHVQSIAALGHLVRHRGVRLHGDAELTGLLGELGARTRPERRRDDVEVDLEVRAVHRDASMYQAIAEDTWVLCFGWYMHALFRVRHGFPLHRNLRPVFVSFHCNKRELLTPEAIEYLRRYGPVGCRDWTTVHLLLSAGVPAFFSGCVTTTIDTVFPDGPPPGPDAPVAYVDTPAPEGGVAYAHSDDAVRRRPFTANVRIALERLETYRREHRAVVTSRLHCYLPLRSIGVDVEFRPDNPADVRLDGLLGISDDAFAAMRDGLLGKLDRIFEAILGGRPEADVYALWRELTADDVAHAEEQRRPAAPAALAPAARAALPADGPIHCAVAVRRKSAAALSVLAASLLEHASRPLQLWVLAPEGADELQRRVTGRFPQLAFTWVPAGAAGEDALALSDLLPELDRVVVLPLPSVATADVAQLADLDLGPHSFAAPTRTGAREVSGFGLINDAAKRLRDRTDAATALRRTAYARHAFDFDAFGDEVLVVDLARWRAEDVAGRGRAAMAEYGLSGLEALHYLAGADRATIPSRWAAVPTRTPERGPGLLHWADRVKPAHAELTPERDRWRAYAAALRSGDG